MAGRFRTERPQLRTVGTASLKPVFASTSTGSRPEWGLASRSTKAQPPAEPTRSNAIEVTKEEKPLRKSPTDSGRKRKDRRHLRERRPGTGVVSLTLPGVDKNDEQAGEARQTMENTKQNESIGGDDFTPSPSEVSLSFSARSSRVARDDVDLDRRDKQDLIDRLEQLEKSLDKKNKEVESLKSENQRLRDDNNALLRVVNQVSSLKTK